MRIVLIGEKNKLLSHNVVAALVNNNYNLGLVVFRVRENKINYGKKLKRIITRIKLEGLSVIIEIYKERKKSSKTVLNTKEYCNNNDVKYIEIENINSLDIEKSIKSINPDLIILAGSPVIKNKILKLARLYTINIHRSLLPKYAGLDAIFWALYNNEKEIGATVHCVNEGIDTGDIIIQEKKIIEANDNLESLTNWYYDIAPDLIIKALEIIKRPNHKFIKQDLSKRTYYYRPSLKDQYELKKKESMVVLDERVFEI